MTLALHGKSRRRVSALLLLASISIAGAIVAAVALNQSDRAAAASVTPNIFDAANPTCADVDGTLAGGQIWIGVSTESAPTNNQQLNVAGQGTITINNLGLQGGIMYFNWSSTFGIDAVIVKQASSNHYVYVYAPNAGASESLGDAMLRPNENPGGISHVTFCYDSTNPPTNTSTNTATNTSTNTPTNTPTSTLTSVTQTQVLETPTNTPTNTPTPTGTLSAETPTNTPTATNTPINTPTIGANTPTNTAVAPTNTPTNTPVAQATSNDPVVNPSPSISIVQGEKTPGPTPKPPSTGSGATTGGQGMNLLAAIAGLVSVSAGLGAVATSRRRR